MCGADGVPRPNGVGAGCPGEHRWRWSPSGVRRGELSPYSDVDLMLLHDAEEPRLPQPTSSAPYGTPSSVGHSVRTVGRPRMLPERDSTPRTTLLTSRLVAGSKSCSHLMDAVTRVTQARPLRRYLVEAERSRRAEAPYRLMSVDIKPAAAVCAPCRASNGSVGART